MDGNYAVDTYAEFLFDFQPRKMTEQGCCSGSIEITLVICGNIDIMKLVSSSQRTMAKRIIDQQAIDAQILLENKFGGYLSRLNSSSFDSPQRLMNEVLDEWNIHWRKSSAMWNPFYAGLKTGIFPSKSSHYLHDYRFIHFGDSNA